MLLLQEFGPGVPQKEEEGWAWSPDPRHVGRSKILVFCMCLVSNQYGPWAGSPGPCLTLPAMLLAFEEGLGLSFLAGV